MSVTLTYGSNDLGQEILVKSMVLESEKNKLINDSTQNNMI